MRKEAKAAVLKAVTKLLETATDQLEYDIYGVDDKDLINVMKTTLEKQADVNIQLAVSFLNKLNES
jgi:hypothetical protein